LVVASSVVHEASSDAFGGNPTDRERRAGRCYTSRDRREGVV